MPYEINGIVFRSQDEVKERCRQIRDRATRVGLYDVEYGVVYVLGGDDETFMVDFINHHQDASDIIGCGISCVQVCVVPKGKHHWGFCVMRHDASERIFGFNKFGARKESIRKQRMAEAFRNAISKQTIEYKEQYFDGHPEAICEATGELMTRMDCHVDHEWPVFNELVKKFTHENPTCHEVTDDGLFWNFINDDYRKLWQEFHRSNAKLRCVTKSYNLTRKIMEVPND